MRTLWSLLLGVVVLQYSPAIASEYAQQAVSPRMQMLPDTRLEQPVNPSEPGSCIGNPSCLVGGTGFLNRQELDRVMRTGPSRSAVVPAPRPVDPTEPGGCIGNPRCLDNR